MAWETVKKHTRRLSDGLRRSPIKEKPLGSYYSKREDENVPIQLQLGDAQLLYDDLEWTMDGPIEGAAGKASQIVKDLTAKNRALEAENQLLKFKVNVLLDQLTAAKLDVVYLQHAQRQEASDSEK